MPSEPNHTPEGDRKAAERQFVDREEFVAPVEAALKEPARTKPLVLVYHGGAGIGKSRLRRELVRQLARDPEVLTATLDFSVTSHQHPESALFFLRRTLCEAHQVAFPSFDIAYAIMWQKTHPETPLGDDLKLVLEPGSLLPQLLDESGRLPLVGLVPRISSLLGKPPEPQNPRTLEPFYFEWWERRGERELEDIPQMEPGAIVDFLPKLWAADLREFLVHRWPRRPLSDSASLIAHRRAVLFIDSYEKLWGMADGGRETEDGWLKTDAWVRELVKQLPEVLWVVCGRQKLRWEEVEADWGKALSQHQLEALPEKSARKFLESCDIPSGQMQDAMIKGSQGVPHYLNLAADALQNAKGKLQNAKFGGGSPEELVEQFTRQLDKPEVETLKVLSAARFWYYGLFEHLMTEYQTGYSPTAYDDLSRFSFISEGAAPGTRTMHELMREALQEHQAPELRKRVHLFLHEYYAKQLEGLDVKRITERHEAALTEAFYHGRQSKSPAGLWTWFITALSVFDEAKQHRLLVPLLREAVELMEAGLGHAHPLVAESLFVLARHLDAGGEYEEAEPLFRRALLMAEEKLGPNDQLVVNCLSSLAEMLRKRARFEEAEVMCRRVVELRSRPGEPAINQAEALDNLATVLAERDKYAEAEELLRRAVAISEKEVGPEHAKTGTKLHNLASMLWMQGRLSEAESLFRRALAIDEKALGVNHPNLVFSLDGLANTLHNLGRYAEAEPLLRRSLKLCEENLGLEHPDTAICMNNLGSLLRAQNRFAAARPLLQRALDVHEKRMGSDHPLTIRMAGNLISGLVMHGDYAEAEPMLLRALETREKKLGPDNPATFFLVHWAGVMYTRQGRYAEAERYLRRAVEVTTRVRGQEHPDALASLNALGSLEEQRGQYEEAESLFRDVLAKREKMLGPDHPDVADTSRRLAEICCRDGRYPEAEALYRRALAIRERVFGPDNTLVAGMLEGLAKVCEQTGRAAEAQELSARAKRIRTQAAGEKIADSRQ